MYIQEKDTHLGVLFIKVTIPHPINPCSTSGPLLKRGINGRNKKESLNFLKLSSQKVAMTYSPTNLCSTIGAVGLNFSVRDGKRWIPDAIDRLNI